MVCAGNPTAAGRDVHDRIVHVTSTPATAAQPESAAVLRALLTEVESFVHADGWDGPRKLFALVPTRELLAHEPQLIGQIGGDGEVDPTSLTPVEQGTLPGDTVADGLAKIAWPDEIAGAILVLEIMVDSGGNAAEGRLAVGVLRDEAAGLCALRWRHSPDGPITYSPDLAPDLVAALQATFEA